MDDLTAVESAQGALFQCLLIGGPILLVVLVVGLLISLLQTITNIHDASVGFIPKLIVLAVALGVGGPWLFGKLADYSRDTFSRPPTVDVRNPR